LSSPRSPTLVHGGTPTRISSPDKSRG
jgi:hypothetical protein